MGNMGNIKINKTEATWTVRELIYLGKKRPECEAGSLVSISLRLKNA